MGLHLNAFCNTVSLSPFPHVKARRACTRAKLIEDRPTREKHVKAILGRMKESSPAGASQGPANGRQVVTWEAFFIIFLKKATKLAGLDWALEERQVLIFKGKI